MGNSYQKELSGVFYAQYLVTPKDRSECYTISRTITLTDTEGESAGKEAGVQAVDLSALQAQYPDVRGWLTIPGTLIDYPVMQSGEENPEYYLRRNYRGDMEDFQKLTQKT